MLRDERCWTVASRGVGHIPPGRLLLKEFPLLQRVVRERGPVIIPDVHSDPRWSAEPDRSPPRAGGTEGEMRSWLGVPLIARDEVVGILMVDSHHPYTYGEEEARLAFAFAHQVALAIENSRLYEQMQVKLREATLLHSVTAALSFTLDLDQILPYVARSLCEILNGTSAEIYSLDKEADQPPRSAAMTRVASYVAPMGIEEKGRSDLGQTYALADLPATAESLAQRRPIQARVGDPEADPHLLTRLEAHGAQATLLLPMVAGDRVLGLAQVWEGQVPRRFTEGEITTGQALIHQAAITIYNAQLVEALRQHTAELEAQNAELDAFAHTVAHDLKIPLTSLIGFSSLLETRFTKMSDEKLRRNLQIIGQNGRKMKNIIDELLLLASIRKMEEIETGHLDMASIVVEAQGRLADAIAEHQAEIIIPENWPAALGYGPWIEEVWVNYLSNALKYGGRPPRVELGFDVSTPRPELGTKAQPNGATEQKDGTVRFWVRDNGPGLTPEEQAQLFTPFTRLHQVQATGHGLGLSIVQRIVEKLGGQVGVESPGVPGQGSTFSFTLPGAPQ
jgi:signal transduction histidine kinase